MYTALAVQICDSARETRTLLQEFACRATSWGLRETDQFNRSLLSQVLHTREEVENFLDENSDHRNPSVTLGVRYCEVLLQAYEARVQYDIRLGRGRR